MGMGANVGRVVRGGLRSGICVDSATTDTSILYFLLIYMQIKYLFQINLYKLFKIN